MKKKDEHGTTRTMRTTRKEIRHAKRKDGMIQSRWKKTHGSTKKEGWAQNTYIT